MTIVNILDHGGVGDGVTDNTPAFVSALAAGDTVFIPYTPQGYKVSGSVVVPSNKTIFGENRVSLLCDSSTLLFDLRGSNVRIANVHIKNTDKAVLLNTSVTSMEFVHIENAEFSNVENAVCDSNSVNLVVNLHIRDITCWYGRGRQIDLNDAYAFLFMRDVTIDHARNVGIPIDFSSIFVADNNGMTMERVNINGNSLGGGDGMNLVRCQAIHLREVMADTLGGRGITFANCNYIYMTDVVSSLCMMDGIRFANCNFIQGSNIVTAGRLGLEASPTAKGMIFQTCTQIQIPSLSTRNNNGIGLLLQSCTTGSIGVVYSNNITNLSKTSSTVNIW